MEHPGWPSACCIKDSQNETNRKSMKTNLKTLGLPMLLAAALSVVGCRSTGEGGRTAGRVLDDDNINTRVETALQDAPTYKFDGVKVSTYAGVVQLSGWVSTSDQKSAAERIAQNIQGSQKVINSIAVHETTERVQSAEQPQTQPRATGGTSDNP